MCVAVGRGLAANWPCRVEGGRGGGQGHLDPVDVAHKRHVPRPATACATLDLDFRSIYASFLRLIRLSTVIRVATVGVDLGLIT